MINDLFSRNDSLYIYKRSKTSEESLNCINEMIESNGLTELTNTKIVYENSLSGEVIVLSLNDTSTIKQFLNPDELILVSMEKRTVDFKDFISESGSFYFEGGNKQNYENAYSGNASILLTELNPFGLKISLPVNPGNQFRLGVWQKNFSW